jgi:hypothetical protein
MNKIYLLVLAGGLLAACGGPTSETKNDPFSTEAPEEKKNEKAVKMTFEEGLEKKDSERRLVEVEGYVQLSVISSFSEKGQTVSFYGRRNQKSGPDYYTTMPIGNGKNEMRQLPKEYSSKDVLILDNQGKKVLANERVKLTGYFYTLGTTGYLEVTRIDKVEDVALDYETLKFPKLEEKHKSDNKAFDKGYQVEGKLSVPMYVLIDDETTVDITDKAGKKYNLKVVTGSGPGQIEELKEGWSNNDVKIRNDQGKLVSLGKNAKVYGVLKLDGLHVESIVQ